MPSRIALPNAQAVLGTATIAFAIAFNVPYAILSTIFDYPAVLRRPAGEVLTLFNAGGAPLILTWHAFALAAFLFVPLAIVLSLRADRIMKHPALATGAAIAGSLAGLAQAIGLWRWVFVVPTLAKAHVDPAAPEAVRSAAENTFNLINLYGGVAIGEHIGQLLTALFVLLLSIVLLHEKHRAAALIGFVTAAAIALGTGEGLAMALGQSGEIFSLFTIAGFLLLTVWLIALGITYLRPAAR
ncbi:MAG: DUF4386 family protein [Devosia sp.]|nr:DUF4386 family protein [Devosia sp.]